MCAMLAMAVLLAQPAEGAADAGADLRAALEACERGDCQAVRRLLASGNADGRPQCPPAAACIAAVCAARQGHLEEARRELERLSRQDGDERLRKAAFAGLGELAFRRGAYDEALELFVRAEDTSSNESSAAVALRKAQCLAHLGQWTRSLATAQSAGRPDDPSAQAELDYLIGCCHAAQSRHAEARQHFLRAAQSAGAPRAKTAARALWMLAHSRAATGETAAARETFLRLESRCAADPNLAAGALVEAGRCAERMADWPLAERDYRRALEKYGQAEAAEQATRRLAVVEARRAATRKFY